MTDIHPHPSSPTCGNTIESVHTFYFLLLRILCTCIYCLFSYPVHSSPAHTTKCLPIHTPFLLMPSYFPLPFWGTHCLLSCPPHSSPSHTGHCHPHCFPTDTIPHLNPPHSFPNYSIILSILFLHILAAIIPSPVRSCTNCLPLYPPHSLLPWEPLLLIDFVHKDFICIRK